MSSWIITLLISLGMLISAEQWNNMSSEEKENVKSIIIDIDSISSAPAYNVEQNYYPTIS